MAHVSVRIPDELEEDLREYMQEENLDRSSALRRLLTDGLDGWKRRRALRLLEAGDVTFSKAAEVAEMNVWEFSELVKNERVTWVNGDSLRDEIESA